MKNRIVKYYPAYDRDLEYQRKQQIQQALVPVLQKKIKAQTNQQPGLIFKIARLNKIAKKTEINRLTAIFRKYLSL